MLIDTNVAIYLRDRHIETRKRAMALGEPLAISLISMVDLEGGTVARPALAASRRMPWSGK